MGKKVYELRHKPIVFLVDGIDCSGKSYLVQALSKEYPGLIIKPTFRPRFKDKKEILDYKRYIYGVMDFINHHRQSKIIILDRFCTSERVYSQVKRGYEAYDDTDYIKIDKSLACMPNLYIYCNPGYETIINRLKSRGDDYINEGDVKELSNRYDRLYRETRMNKLNLDTSKTADEMLAIIKQKIENYEH